MTATLHHWMGRGGESERGEVDWQRSRSGTVQRSLSLSLSSLFLDLFSAA